MNIEESISRESEKKFDLNESNFTWSAMIYHIKKIEPRKGKLIRNDIFKTKIAWAIARVPLDLVYSNFSNFVWVIEYKSPVK